MLDDALNGTQHVYHSPPTSAVNILFPEYRGLAYKNSGEIRRGLRKEIPTIRKLIKELAESHGIDFAEELQRLNSMEEASRAVVAKEPAPKPRKERKIAVQKPDGTCPACGRDVQAGQLKCGHCGVNLQD
jgi:hypothetical protein